MLQEITIIIEPLEDTVISGVSDGTPNVISTTDLNLTPVISNDNYAVVVSPGIPVAIPGSGGAQTGFREVFTLTNTELTNKGLTLSNTPNPANKVTITVQGGVTQFYNVDFTVSGDQISWDSLSLELYLVTGDKIIVDYLVE